MTYQGVRNWPPVWTREFGPETYAAGEVGTLEEVRRSVLDNQCYLAIQYNGSRYVGFLQCDDREFFEKVYHSLMQSCGQPIHAIGELDFDLSYESQSSSAVIEFCLIVMQIAKF